MKTQDVCDITSTQITTRVYLKSDVIAPPSVIPELTRACVSTTFAGSVLSSALPFAHIIVIYGKPEQKFNA